MRIKIDSKDGVVLHTAKQYCEEDIIITLDSSLFPSGKIEITDTNEVDVTAYETAQINDNNLKAENIAEGVEILGVVGNFKGGIEPSGKYIITNTQEVDVTQYAKAQVIDENLKAENIVENVEVLGIIGTYRRGGLTPEGTLDIVENGEYDVTTYEKANVAIPEYTEAYEVTPKTYEAQTLETKNKLLVDNVTVKEIPISKASNMAGGYTVTIGDIPVDKNGETILLNVREED